MRADRILAWLLRLCGAIDLIAATVVFAPADWIAYGHEATGLGPLPDAVIVHYLTRSTSILYALHGALLLGLSTDVVRYRPVIAWLGVLAILHGLMIFGVDTSVGMPTWWRWVEGPTFVTVGILLLICALLVRPRETNGP